MPKIEVHFRRFVISTLLAALWTCSGTSAHADSSTASLTVSVMDSSGAVIPGAHLVLRNADTNQEQTNDSGKTGGVTFSFLRPGHYSLTVSKNAFADVVVDRILLNVGDEKHLQLLLKVGSAAQTINVDGSGLTINTTDASVSTVIDQKFVENIPLNGRSFQDLISMTPGVATQSPQTSSSIGYRGDFSVNGQRTESNYYIVDGVSGNNGAGYPTGGAQSATGGTIASSTVLGTTQSLLSVDAMQEFRVESSTYSAEYGRSPGGQFSLLTRSGTNAFHGTLYDFLRNNFFDANDWFNDHYGKPITTLRQNDFGGPVIVPWLHRDEHASFFFVSYEGLRLTVPQPASIQYVPNAAIRQSAAATLQPILNAYPLPTAGGIAYGTLAQFIASYSVPGRIDSTSVRLDHRFSPNISAFFRFGDTPSSTQTRTLSSLQTITGGSQTYTLGVTAQATPTITNEFRLGYAENDSILESRLDGFGGAQPIDLRSTMGLTSIDSAYALFYLYFAGVGSAGLSELTASNSSNQWNAVDTASVTIGHSQLKFGADYRRIAAPLNPPSPYIFAQITSRASLVNNAADTLQVKKSIAASPVFRELALFAEDDWKPIPRISLALGLRWELNPPPMDSDGGNAYTLLGSTSNPSQLTLAPQGTSLWKTAYYNFAPRLGAAWQAHTTPGWETVVRAGGGVFFDTDNAPAASGFSGLGFSSYNTYNGSPLPITPSQVAFPISVTPPYTTASVYAFPAHLQLPYTLQWNVTLEQALTKSQSFTLSYVGSNGRRLLQSQTLYLKAVNPNFGYVYYYPTGVSSNYQSLQARMQRSVTKGMQALASYTWSHSIDFGSNNSELPLTRGNSDFDVRSNLQAGLSWELPTFRGNRIKDLSFSDWGFDGRLMARTGFPITLQGSTLTNPATGIYSSNVNLVPGQPIYLYGFSYPGGRALNRAAFSLPTGTDPGDAPRNFVRGFGATQLNMAARKDFHVFETATLQFRAEAFNILNHPVFGYVDPALSDATFGEATKTLAQSLGTMSALYQQGGARSMQFALKLKF